MTRMTHRPDGMTTSPVADERGVALLICLLVMAILTVVVFQFHYEVQVETALVGNSFEALEAEYAARSGVTFCLAMLRTDAENDSMLPADIRTDNLTEGWVAGLEPMQVARATVAARITDEDGKLNINRAVDEKKPTDADEQVVAQLTQLFSELDILSDADPVQLTTLVCDWLDPDSVERDGGAESTYYQSLPVPYRCKNSLFGSIEELALVRGFSPQIIFGQRAMTESGSLSEEEMLPGLAEFVTVHGDREGRININTAPEPVIRALFYESPLVAESIISQRAVAPFAGLKDLQQRVPQKLGTGVNVSFRSNCFAILSEGNVHGVRVSIETAVRRILTPRGVRFDTVAWKVIR
jgi:general secretion pathway protein K